MLQSDNIWEFFNHKCDDFMKKYRIILRLTVPHNPNHEKAERMNRTLLDTAKCLLFQINLPHKFWTVAINTAYYIQNCLLSKSRNGETPYELWIGMITECIFFESIWK